MKLARSFAIAALLTLAAVPVTVAAEVRALSWQVMDQWLSGSAAKISGRFANKTIQINVTRRALGGLKGGPPTGPLIIYLAKGGSMLTWTANAKVVGTGRWEIKSMGAGVEIPCFYFDGPKGRSDCFFGGTANYVQAANSNVFGLKAGGEVPANLNGRATIATLAAKLGV